MSSQFEDGSVEVSKTPSRNSTLFFNRGSKTEFSIRVYPFQHRNENGELKYKLGRSRSHHWVNGKPAECLGDKCKLCQSDDEKISKVTDRMQVCIVERKNGIVKGKASSGKNSVLQIYDMPISLFRKVEAEYNTNGNIILGDTGITFKVTYNASTDAKNQYTMSTVLLDKEVLDIGDKLLWYDPKQAPKKDQPTPAQIAELDRPVEGESDAAGDPDDDDDDGDSHEVLK